MNALEALIVFKGWDETEAMNALQDSGIISDCCVWAEDVSSGNCDAAIDFLRNNKRQKGG